VCACILKNFNNIIALIQKKNQKVLKSFLFFIIIILLSVCLVTEFFEQMKKTDHKEDIPRGYVLEDLEDHDKNIH